MGNYKLFNNRFVSVRSLCNQSNVQLNFVRLAKWEISFGEFCYIQMAFVRWTGIRICCRVESVADISLLFDVCSPSAELIWSLNLSTLQWHDIHLHFYFPLAKFYFAWPLVHLWQAIDLFILSNGRNPMSLEVPRDRSSTLCILFEHIVQSQNT